jgi:hypothetical protein
MEESEMGIDYYSCKRCGEGFPDCGDYVSCGENCSNHWCSYECAKEDGFVQGENEDGDRDYYKDSCKYCREENFEDSALLEFALITLELTRDELVEMYKSRVK